MENIQGFKKFREGMEELLYASPTNGDIALALGAPYFSSDGETAWVQYDASGKNGKKVLFSFNPDFILSLSAEKIAGVILHETFHVLRKHLDTSKDPAYKDKNALIMAQECTINDYITIILGLELPEGCLFGEDLIGQSTENMTLYQAYKLFEKKDEDGDSQDGDEAEGACGGFDSIPDEGLKEVMHSVAGEMGISDEDLQEKINESYQDQNTIGSIAGNGEPNKLMDIKGDSSRMNWLELLKEINPDVMNAFKPNRQDEVLNWGRKNVRYQSTTAIIPSHRIVDEGQAKGKVPTLLIALDVSGSIDNSLIHTLVGMISDVPSDFINPFAITWSDEAVPYDEEHNFRTAGRLGTRISSVTNYAKKIMREEGEYPYVVCITDGEFYDHYSISNRNKDRWTWMAVDERSYKNMQYYMYGLEENVFNVKDFKM